MFCFCRFFIFGLGVFGNYDFSDAYTLGLSKDFNQLSKVTEGTRSRHYTYNAFGNRLCKEETEKDTIEYHYNALNQLQ